MLMLLIDTNRHGCTSMPGLLQIKSSNSVFNIVDLCFVYVFLVRIHELCTKTIMSTEAFPRGFFTERMHQCDQWACGASCESLECSLAFPVAPRHDLSTQSLFTTSRLRCLLATLLNLCRHVSWWPGSLKLWCVSSISNHKVKMVLTEMKLPTACILGMS